MIYFEETKKIPNIKPRPLAGIANIIFRLFFIEAKAVPIYDGKSITACLICVFMRPEEIPNIKVF